MIPPATTFVERKGAKSSPLWGKMNVVGGIMATKKVSLIYGKAFLFVHVTSINGELFR